ncbi:hypothetical protein [Microbacterium terricola]|uniref:Uncharacterized protein n=1 Tax=Microbacterium terricola TaxID=344163 RepID=A0ABM8DVG9_9MICO|nr:hypothetical protein [Microbacterium terricola]UYK39740.1 hypothetical protein OAU46_13750 [Microbacterium terricola]BDV29510.1 hypothetical protein Microterr_01700 [Microbacterium terricola]
MTADSPTPDLFVGQMVALIPRQGTQDGRGGAPDGPRIFPRNIALPADDDDERTVRPKTYSVITDGAGHGILTVRQTEIAVDILPLDLATPPEATVFRVVAVAGRAIRVTGVVE